jgi:hypothetical protein
MLARPGGRRNLTKHEFRIKFHAVFFQQRDQLRLEIHLRVMQFLILYISNDRRNAGRTDAKRRITLLPREFIALLVRPPRRIRFDGEDRLRDRQRRRNLDEEMNMIVRPAHGMNENPVVFADACDVCPHSRL